MFLVLVLSNNYNQISIKIIGNGTQRILSDYFGSLPDKIIINEKIYDNNIFDKYVYNLTESENNITMIWENILTSLYAMFRELYNISEIDFSKFNSSNINNAGYLFGNCWNLVSIDLSKIHTSLVEDMSYMFYGCKSKYLNLNNFDTSLVQNMKSMFDGCGNLTSLDIFNFNTTKVEDISYLFSGCISLITLNLSNFNTSSVTNMEHLFYDCEKMKALYIDNFDTSKVEIMTGMFEFCSSLTSLNIKHFNTSSAISMFATFNGCRSLTSLDVSSFNTSSVKNMHYMFQDCVSLTSLDLSNFDTSEVEIMEIMFQGCINLKLLNLSNFRTYSLKNIKGMFKNCNSLEILDISNFDISNVEDISEMFSECHNLYSLNLNNFNTSSVKYMYNIFENCYSLKSLNLSNWDMSSIINVNYAFKGCKNLMILDLNNLNFSNVEIYDYIFEDINNNLSFCINGNENSPIFEKLLSLQNNNCPCYLNPENKIIFENYKCLNNCNNDNFYIYEYNNMCYSSCPNGTKIKSNHEKVCEDIVCKNNYYNYNQTQCIEEIPKGYYLNDSYLRTIDICDIKCENCSLESNKYNLCISCHNEKNYYEKLNDSSNYNSYKNCYDKTPESYILEDNIYKPCYHSCKNCFGFGNEEDNKCISCIDGYEFKYDFENDTNCYNICDYYYYFDINLKYYCTSDNQCPNEYKLIREKRKCVINCTFDEKYQCEYNNTCQLCQNITDIYSHNNNFYNLTMENITQSNDSLIIGECKLKDFLNNKCKINNKKDKIEDAKMKDKIIDDIRREILNGDSMNDLINNLYNGDEKDLVIEDDNLIYRITSTEIQENSDNINVSTINLGECGKILKNKYNISQNQSLIIFKIDYFKEGSLIPIIGYEIYNPLTKEKLNLDPCENTNINLNIPIDIKEENLYKYDPENEYYTDKCNPSTTGSGTDILLNDRHNEFNINNMSLCQKNCKYTGYNNKKAICQCGINNEQIVISDLVNQNDLLSYEFENKNDMITMKCYRTLFTKDGLIGNIGNYILLSVILLFMISSILFYKCGYNLLEDKIKEICSSKSNIKQNKNINIKETSGMEKKYCKMKSIKTTKSNKIKKKKKKKMERFHKNLKQKNDKSDSKIEFKINQFIEVNQGYNLSTKKKIKKDHNHKGLINYDDFELNLLLYKDAIKYDKRRFCGYYISLIKRKHPLIFHFCQLNDYNSMIIKVCLFFLSFSIYYFINALFFDESTIHQIYEDEGIYNFIYLVPHISYSFIISHTLSFVFKFIFLSERNLFEIKSLKNLEEIDEIVHKTKRCISIKYICFFVLSIIFLSFFWYYLSSFGAVFQNTQIYIIKNTSICIGFSLIYPFVINIFPSIFRIHSMSDKNRKCSFNISKFLQYI